VPGDAKAGKSKGLRLLMGGMVVSAAMVIPSRMKHMRKRFGDLHDDLLGVITDGVFLSFLVCILSLKPPGTCV